MKNWKEIIEKNEETIIAAIVEAHREMFGQDLNWQTYIIIDEDGKVFREEAYGNTRNMYNKETLIVATVNAWNLEDEDFESNKSENLTTALKYDDEAANMLGQNAYDYYYNDYVNAYNNDETDEEFEDWFEEEFEDLYEQYKNEYDEAAKKNLLDNFDASEYDLYECVVGD